MMKQCDIVQDLLPLHIDGILRQSTDEFVRNHLMHCTQCSHARDDLLNSSGKWERYSDLAHEHSVQLEGEKAFIEDIKKWRQRVVGAFISIVIVLSALSWFVGKSS